MSAVARIAALVVVVVTFCARATFADPSSDEAKAAGRHLLIALRVLSYDKQLADRTPGQAVTIAFVSSPTPEGRALRAQWEAGFALMPKVKVGGRPVKTMSFDATSDKIIEKQLAAGPSAVIVVDALGERFLGLRQQTRAHHILSISLSEDDAVHGLAVAIVAGRERDQIVVNIEASRAEDVRFGAGLLQLAQLVDEGGRK
ncbi:MAG TPA: YfiR family protein [Kofleriaceae bacterium]|jgi:hypothetical protein